MNTLEALKVLGLDSSATKQQVKEAYRDLAKVWHPDRFPKDTRLRHRAEGTFKEINAAYQHLKSFPWSPHPAEDSMNPAGVARRAGPSSKHRSASHHSDQHSAPSAPRLREDEYAVDKRIWLGVLVGGSPLWLFILYALVMAALGNGTW